MKPVSDILQIVLNLPGALGFIACMLVVALVWQCVKSAGELLTLTGILFQWLRARLIRVSLLRVGFIAIAAIPVYFARYWVSDRLQYMEQVFAPAYITGDTSAHTLAIYEAELSRHCDQYEADIVKRRVREIAAKVGSTPLAIFEVAYSECDINPFRVRKDGIAAGFLQFTSVGASGMCSLAEVKDICKRRDVVRMMDLSERYLVSRAAGRPLPDATAVYVATFAPGFIGYPDGQVLYSGWDNPAYYLNDIFDGYYVDASGRIIRAREAMDGKITIGELRLHLEAKKSRLVRTTPIANIKQ